jgi:hypothetical protein
MRLWSWSQEGKGKSELGKVQSEVIRVFGSVKRNYCISKVMLLLTRFITYRCMHKIEAQVRRAERAWRSRT